MTQQTTVSSVTFVHSFKLPDMDGPYPPGTYAVETDTETLDSFSQLACRRVATRIVLTKPGLTEVLTVQPRDLEFALLQDRL